MTQGKIVEKQTSKVPDGLKDGGACKMLQLGGKNPSLIFGCIAKAHDVECPLAKDTPSGNVCTAYKYEEVPNEGKPADLSVKSLIALKGVEPPVPHAGSDFYLHC